MFFFPRKLDTSKSALYLSRFCPLIPPPLSPSSDTRPKWPNRNNFDCLKCTLYLLSLTFGPTFGLILNLSYGGPKGTLSSRLHEFTSLRIHQFMSLGPVLQLKNAASGVLKSRSVVECRSIECSVGCIHVCL